MTTFKRFLAGALTLAMTAALFVGCAGGGAKKINDGNYPASPDYFKTIGRYTVQEDAENNPVYWFSLSASGLEFSYENCTKVTFDLKGDTMAADKTNSSHDPRYGVIVNDTMVMDAMLSALEESVTVDLPQSEGVVRFVKLSESSDSTMGIAGIHVDGKIAPTPAADLKIEFIGDSITCGYGADGTIDDTYMTSNENSTKTYAYLTAKNLGADYSMVSYSGYGIYSGYATGNEPNTASTLPQYYDAFGNSYGTIPGVGKPNEIVWDHTLFEPDYIVINLGTNDASFCKKPEQKEGYVNGYIDFLKKIRSVHPQAHIIASLGIMGQDMLLSMQEAVGKYMSDTSDENVSIVEFDVQDAANDGVVVDWHPSLITATKAAEKLTAHIESLQK